MAVIEKRPLRYTIFTALFFMLASGLWAQTAPADGFQRLVWTGDGYALRYEIIIEVQEFPGVYREVFRGFSEVPFIDVSLLPGLYRHRVIPHDFLELPGQSSQWVSFEVRPVLLYPDPDIDFAPDIDLAPDTAQRLTWIADEYVWYYEVELQMEIEGIFRSLLRRFSSMPYIEIPLTPGRYRFRVIPFDFLDRPGAGSGWVYFEVPSLLLPDPEPEPEPIEVRPEPEIVEVEPEPEIELEPEIEPVEVEPEPEPEPIEAVPGIEYRRPVAFQVSLAWMPMFLIYSESQFPGGNSTLSGIVARLGLLSARDRPINPGLELAAAFHAFDDAQSVTMDVNLMAQKWLSNERTALNMRIGAGFSLLPENLNTYGISGNNHSFNANMGFSLQQRLGRRLFIEAGVDYINLLSVDQSGWVRPWIGTGWRR